LRRWMRWPKPCGLDTATSIDADLSKYFDTIPHAKLLAVVAERISDGAILALIKQWLKAAVVEEGDGKRCTGGGKGNRQGTREAWGNFPVAGEPVSAPVGSDRGAP
jgi:retron-type reverse transcriptase